MRDRAFRPKAAAESGSPPCFYRQPGLQPKGWLSSIDRCSRSTAATAHGPSTRWWARSTSSGRSATRSSSTRSITPTCSSARAAPGRPPWRSCWPAPSTPRAAPGRSSTRSRRRRGRSWPGPRSTWSRWTRPRTTPSTTSASCARTSRSPRCRAASASTSSTRRTCSRTAAWNAFLKTLEEPPAARGVRAGHDRGAQGARHDHRPLPPLRLPAALARADRRGAAPGGGARRGSRFPIPPWGCWLARPPAPSAMRSARSSSSSPTAATT